jgi:8-oxo-dGTP pyrophosphatase MutT (NUDIX family)
MKHRIRVVGIVRRDDKILLIEQENPRTGQRSWSAPGGGLEPADEDIFAGVEREVLEETGLRVRSGAIRCISEYAIPDENFMQVSLWIECFLHDDQAPTDIHLGNNRPDDYLTGVQWWTREAISESPGMGYILMKNEFWDSLDAPGGMVAYLGKRTG